MDIPGAIGPFVLRRRIGQGTYGGVFEAFDARRNVRVAVKVFDKAPRGAAAFARLRRDARAAGALGHPNIASVLSVGEHEGSPWVATELITGVSLAQVASSSAVWPIERVLDIWRQLCEGLAHAHREGLLHLDLKPSDVRVSTDGEVKVLDFGAWHVKTLERRHPGPLDESLHYRPPEVIAGRRPDRRVDIFAVAAMMYELITRRRAFPGEATTDVIRSISRCAPDLATLPSSPFSPGLERILSASLERDPARRPPCFEDVHADLVQLVRETAPRLRERGEGEPAATTERESLLAELTEARTDDRLEDAREVCRRLLALDPEDESGRRSLSEIESIMVCREADELVGKALSLAADGEIEAAARIAPEVERIAPWSPRYLQLQVYLDEERARRDADRLVEAARVHRAEGRVEDARTMAENALATMPGHAAAARLLGELGRPGASPHPSAPSEDEPSTPPTRSEDAVGVPVSSAPGPGAGPVDPHEGEDPGAGGGPSPPSGPPASSPEAPPASAENRARAEALMATARRHLTAGEHARARDSVERALDLDPSNPHARGLQRILRALG